MAIKMFALNPGIILLTSILTFPTPPYPSPNGPLNRPSAEPNVGQTTGRHLPDLKFDRSRTVNITIEQRVFAADHCAVVERCVRASGKRSLLRFDISVANVGKGDLKLGDPRNHPRVFQFSPCHGHYHFRDLITYEVHNAHGNLVFRGSKQAFCLRDNYKYLENAPESHGYDCDNQGITSGWEDVYDRSLDCQWIDVTGIKPGKYTLKATLNASRRIQESNLRNNSMTVSFTVPAGTW
jgi:hypothetical protein